MPATRAPNRGMFWRIVRALLSANRARLFVILLALGAGAAITAALLNLQIDAKRRIYSEFRTFGANVIVAPQKAGSLGEATTMPESVAHDLSATGSGSPISATTVLYAIATATSFKSGPGDHPPLGTGPVIVTGYSTDHDDFGSAMPYKILEGNKSSFPDLDSCEIGQEVSVKLHTHARDLIQVETHTSESYCTVDEVLSFGGQEDNQIFLPLNVVQQLDGRPGQISLVQANIPGSPKEIQNRIDELRNKLPGVTIRPLYQFTEGEAKIYARISALLDATVIVVLVLTGLCVMAAMTNVAMERKNDVGLMKAIGGATRRVMRLFFAEAALLGFVGGVLGAAAGILLSVWLGKAVFGVAARPRLIVYPVAVVLTMIVAIIGAFPLRRLASIRPASVFRGEA